ncbi:uncharacterized protein E0L32_004964 [Thyridium curvatum]|uniref:Thioredoxin domain-containing protein n=1 Tax=Thyridium curvatum TaxID=1093900 RepID=A0A507AVM6_9PEZI|nr:uncharacterized protein E0L32_004964 [Thyridium curvatum]TPX14855.1 hypothetical protein E0L32_004964 [Thyridium curvatum]
MHPRVAAMRGSRLAGPTSSPLRRWARDSCKPASPRIPPPSSSSSSRPLSTSRKLQAKNQIYASVRRPEDLDTYIMLSAAARQPLLTLWTASWCPPCRTVHPLVEALVASGVGQAEGGVGFCAVEYDAPDVAAAQLGAVYMVNSLPALLSLDAGEAGLVRNRLVDGRKLADRRVLEEWIRAEARRQGHRGGGGGGGLFGGR